MGCAAGDIHALLVDMCLQNNECMLDGIHGKHHLLCTTRRVSLVQLQRNDMQLPQQTRYTGMIDALRKIVKEEKWHSLFKVRYHHIFFLVACL
jgi:hypothetical protein